MEATRNKKISRNVFIIIIIVIPILLIIFFFYLKNVTPSPSPDLQPRKDIILQNDNDLIKVSNSVDKINPENIDRELKKIK